MVAVQQEMMMAGSIDGMCGYGEKQKVLRIT